MGQVVHCAAAIYMWCAGAACWVSFDKLLSHEYVSTLCSCFHGSALFVTQKLLDGCTIAELSSKNVCAICTMQGCVRGFSTLAVSVEDSVHSADI